MRVHRVVIAPHLCSDHSIPIAASASPTMHHRLHFEHHGSSSLSLRFVPLVRLASPTVLVLPNTVIGIDVMRMVIMGIAMGMGMGMAMAMAIMMVMDIVLLRRL